MTNEPTSAAQVASGEIKACPFCGGEQQAIALNREFGDTTWEIICKACGAHIIRDLEADAIAAWNQRPEPAKHRDLVGEVNEADRNAAFNLWDCEGTGESMSSAWPEAFRYHRLMHGAASLAKAEAGHNALVDKVRTLHGKITLLECALLPFAEAADNFDDCEQHPNGCPDEALAGELVDLTVGDFRAARSTLTAKDV